ncbi:MAG: DNA helicase RecG, partial [Nitrospinaceae bacterium]|nr:DNA helicase RecG [Nitrospinaceae bacterium]NIR57130.1 DNA helicase RecG [Nitrospinaceae bacterium]NIS87571.1 DNA helicase RecG [Nitrospinaceae bacterium]NIT84441.1 DNA helicase RecG [Nitrospinaceae bacterium]NIU46628.1 DNA helicase RecG [Nitrospinaceae bacterium]
RVKKIADLTAQEQVTFSGKVLNAGSYPIGRRKKIFEVIFQDETGTIRTKWFQFNEKYMLERYAPGRVFILSGKPSVPRRGGG